MSKKGLYSVIATVIIGIGFSLFLVWLFAVLNIFTGWLILLLLTIVVVVIIVFDIILNSNKATQSSKGQKVKDACEDSVCCPELVIVACLDTGEHCHLICDYSLAVIPNGTIKKTCIGDFSECILQSDALRGKE